MLTSNLCSKKRQKPGTLQITINFKREKKKKNQRPIQNMTTNEGNYMLMGNTKQQMFAAGSYYRIQKLV